MIVVICLAAASLVSAVDLYPSVNVTAAQKIKAAWAVCVYAYYQNLPNGLENYEVSPGVTLKDVIDPLTLSSESTDEHRCMAGRCPYDTVFQSAPAASYHSEIVVHSVQEARCS